MNETKRLKIFGLICLIMVCLAETLVAYSYMRGVLSVEKYGSLFIFAFAGVTLCMGRYRRQIDLWVGVAFCAWFILSRVLLGETYLEYSFGMLCNLCCAYLVCFPFARSMNDGQQKAGLKAGTAVFGIGYTVLAWLSVLVALSNDLINLPVLGTRIGMKGMRLEAGAHPNISALLFLIALMLIVWLYAQERRRWMIPLALLAFVGLYTGIALTVSRTVMLQTGCFAAGMVFLGMMRLPVRAVWKKAALGFVIGALCLVLVFVSFDWVVDGFTSLSNQVTAHAEAVEKPIALERDFFKDLRTMTGRTKHYIGIMNWVRQEPEILLTGVLNSDLVPLMLQHAGAEHAHNSYLQALVNVGLPGLLMALFFAVRAVWVSVKLIFSQKARFADQLLGVMLLAFLLGTIPESYWFTEYLTAANMPFFLVFGYALEAERSLRA